MYPSMITQDIRNEHYLRLSPAGNYLYSHPESGVRLRNFAEKYSLTENYTQFVNTVGDIILGFYKIEDTVPLLQQELGLDPKTAALLGAEVLEFLAPLSYPSWQPPAYMSEEGKDTTPVVSVEPVAEYRIPVKAPVVGTYAAPSASLPTAPVAEPLVPPVAAASQPSAYAALYQPEAPAEQIYRPAPVVPPRTTLEPMPSYAPTPTPTAPVVPPPAPDRPRWSTDV